jgi:hypothetical protein
MPLLVLHPERTIGIRIKLVSPNHSAVTILDCTNVVTACGHDHESDEASVGRGTGVLGTPR